MKTLFLTCSILLFSLTLSGQKIVIDDQASLLNEAIDSLLSVKFASSGLTYTNVVDYKQRCDYRFSQLKLDDGKYYAILTDCKDKLLGRKKLSNNISTASNSDRATLLYFAIIDMINNPMEEVEISPSDETIKAPTPIVNEPPSMNQEGVEYGRVMLDPSVSEHDSRYFFAPSARPLKKGELYYNTVYFLLHDVQYGITDEFSFGLGTTIGGFPFYVTTKLSFPINEKSYFAVGDLFIIGTYGSSFIGNLLFMSYTYGSDVKNISIGGGLLTTNDDNVTAKQFNFVGNINGLLEIGKYFYLITENYISPIEQQKTAYRPTTGAEGTFMQKNTIWFGISGIRFVTKKNDLASWQIGLTHILNAPGAIPSPYDQSTWDTYESNTFNFLAFPTISFTRKFKLK